MLESRILRSPARGEPLVLAAFSYRYDAHLVAGLIENVGPSVHGYVAWDDRAADSAMSLETARRKLLLAEARRLGAGWILAADPDERFEDRLAERMPEMLAQGERTLWFFDLCEMFSPDTYRRDGVWGGKSQMRLFPMRAVGADQAVPLHARWIAASSGLAHRSARINLYHLRMATPARRRLRREIYAAADPERRFQRIGYDYLDDERGIALERIPRGREFSPPFSEDGGLWSPEPGAIGRVVPDPMEPKLAFVAQSAAQRGHAAAFHVMRELCAASPADDDLAHAAAALALTAGNHGEAEEIAGRLIEKHPGDLHALALRARARLLSGGAGAAADVEALRRAAPQSLVTHRIAVEIGRETADFTAPDADWRRWIRGPATCREGAAVRRAGIAVIVIGLGAPAELASAVASLREQDAEAEIVVVNSGGGRPETVLAAHLDHIRLIAAEERLYVGAARNIGIDASRAEIVGFLAGDCRALPGWVSARLARHRAGALSVSSPVLAQGRARLLPIAVNRLRYWARSPGTHPAYVAHFGRSYARRLFHAAGIFPSGLRVSEDDALNRQVDRIAPPVWAPEVLTAHRDPERLAELWRDNRKRGERRADHPPFRAMATRPDRARALAAESARWLRAGWKAAAADPGLKPWQKPVAKLLQWLANRADRRGVARALARLARADAALAEAERLAKIDLAAAVGAAREAVRLDPQDWRKAHRLGGLLAGAGLPGAEDELRRALSLSPGAAAPAEALARLLLERGAPAEALAETERAALSAPYARRQWELAAEMALAAGQPDLALAHLRRALALAPDLPALHGRLAAVHKAAGNPVPALFRELTRERLVAAEDLWKGRESPERAR